MRYLVRYCAETLVLVQCGRNPATNLESQIVQSAEGYGTHLDALEDRHD